MSGSDHRAQPNSGTHATRPKRPAYLSPPNIGLVLLGGGIGAGLREGFSLWIPEADGVQLVVPVVNLLGAFLLGWLYEALAGGRTAPSSAARLRLLIGTGFCGGLTTYSSLSTDTAVLLYDDRYGVGVAYAAGTVLLGALATIAGIAAGAHGGTRRHAKEAGR